MLCERCNQREANLKYTQILNGEKTMMNLCSKCSQELGLGDMQFNMPLSFSSMFGDFLEPELDFVPKLTMGTMLKCDTCGMTYDEFLNLGKFGCENCYNTFAYKIEPTLKRLHGSTEYLGKRKEAETKIEKLEIEVKNEGLNEISDKKASVAKVKDKTKKELTKEEKVTELKNKLKELIKEENYEEAAKVRDEIKNLEGGKK